MTGIFGVETGLSMPEFSLGGILSSTWIYVLIVVVFGFILIAGLGIVLFFRSYNTKVMLMENMSGGSNFQLSRIVRARKVRLSPAGDFFLVTFGGIPLPPNTKKVSRNTYAYCLGSDGFYYPTVYGDFDAKRGMLDIEPTQRSVINFYRAFDIIIKNRKKKSTLEQMLPYIALVLMFIIFVVGMWFVIGKNNKMAEANMESAKTNADVMKAIEGVMNNPIMINYYGGRNITSGLIPAG
jgi:hypothetical protein